MLDRKSNSERHLVFAYVVLTKTQGACKTREIRARIDLRLDLWERGIHTGLVGDALAEGRAKKRMRNAWRAASKAPFCQEICSRRSVGPRTMREGVSSPGVLLHEDRATSCRLPPGETP